LKEDADFGMTRPPQQQLEDSAETTTVIFQEVRKNVTISVTMDTASTEMPADLRMVKTTTDPQQIQEVQDTVEDTITGPVEETATVETVVVAEEEEFVSISETMEIADLVMIADFHMTKTKTNTFWFSLFAV